MKVGAYIESYPTQQCGQITRLNDRCPICGDDHLWTNDAGVYLCAKCSLSYKLDGEPTAKEIRIFTDVLKNIVTVREEYARMTAEQRIVKRKVAFGHVVTER